MIEFDIWTYHDMMNVCGTVISVDEARKMLTFINVQCENNRFAAYGSDGYRVARLRGKCTMTNQAPVSFLIAPQKAPAHTEHVWFEVKPDSLTIIFLDKKDRTLEKREQVIPAGETLDLEGKIIQPGLKNLDSYNNGEGMYMIVVNPRYLLDALQGVKDCKKVILNFGNAVQPFFIRPYRDDKEVLEMVYPVRIFTDDKDAWRVRNE